LYFSGHRSRGGLFYFKVAGNRQLDEIKLMKNLSVLCFLACSIVVANLCGCASHPAQPVAEATPPPPNAPPPPPPKDKRPIQDRLAIGMTMDQVRAACGNPKNEWMYGDGSGVWDYNDAEKRMIPNYMLFGGTLHFVRVYFDPTGRVRTWSYWKRSDY
jgi:hypothetical protein